MEYEWSQAKAASNIRKHGVNFADAIIALEDEWAITVSDPDSENKERFVSLGSDPMGRVLVTVFTLRDNVLRIISSRKASRTERKRYEEGS